MKELIEGIRKSRLKQVDLYIIEIFDKIDSIENDVYYTGDLVIMNKHNWSYYNIMFIRNVVKLLNDGNIDASDYVDNLFNIYKNNGGFNRIKED